MKCLAIADLFINAAMMESGLKALRDNGIEVEVREWSHGSVEKLQEDNLRVEQEGAEAVALPEALLQGTDDIDILITQFAPVNTAVFDKLPKLKYVGVLRGGVENVNLQVANARGVEVMNTPGRNARSVAEFTVGMILTPPDILSQTLLSIPLYLLFELGLIMGRIYSKPVNTTLVEASNDV